MAPRPDRQDGKVDGCNPSMREFDSPSGLQNSLEVTGYVLLGRGVYVPDSRLTSIGQDVTHKKYGPGVSKGPGDTPDTARVLFAYLGSEKTVRLEDLTISDKPTFQDKRDIEKHAPTKYDHNVQYAEAKEYRPFLEWLWKNAFVLAMVYEDRYEEFENWYQETTGEKPQGTGVSISTPVHEKNSPSWQGRIDLKTKPPEGMAVPPELTINKATKGGFTINSTPFFAQLIARWGFRLGRQAKTNFSGQPQQKEPAVVEPSSQPVDTDISTEESLKNIDQFLGR